MGISKSTIYYIPNDSISNMNQNDTAVMDDDDDDAVVIGDVCDVMSNPCVES